MQNFVRFCLRVFFRVFKTRCSIQFDEKKLPKKGVYVSNHVSFLDPVLLFAFLPGNPVFALNGHLYRRKWIRFLMKTADICLFNPIEPGDIKELIAKVDSGRLVMIFAEGRVTENGGLMKIYEAPGLVADKSKAPIIPKSTAACCRRSISGCSTGWSAWASKTALSRSSPLLKRNIPLIFPCKESKLLKPSRKKGNFSHANRHSSIRKGKNPRCHQL